MSDLRSELALHLEGNRDALAREAMDLQYGRHTGLAERYSPAQKAYSLRDAGTNLAYLLEAAAAGSPGLFADYARWLHSLLKGYGLPDDDLVIHFFCLGEVLREKLPGDLWAAVAPCLEAALADLKNAPAAPAPFIGEGDGPLAGLARLYLDALLKGDRRRARDLVIASADGGTDLRALYMDVFQRSQREIGRLWQMNKVSVAQEHYCTAATQLIMSELYPRLFRTDKTGKVLVAACVGGELHELGIRMVSDFLEMEGWDTYYLGANTPQSSVVQTLEDRRADVLAISATITYHVDKVASLVKAVRERPALNRVRVMVGGYPFNVDPDLWRKVGADGSSLDASHAVADVGRLLGGSPA